MAGDQTSVGDEGWVREWCRSGRGGPVVVLGHEGGSSTRAEGSEVDGGHQDTLDVGAWIWLVTRGVGGRRGRGWEGGEMAGGAPAVWGALVPPFGFP